MDDGIYYAARPAPDRPFAFELRFLNFAAGRHEMLYQFEARSDIGLTISPDRKTILYAGTKPSDGPDLMLIRNFR